MQSITILGSTGSIGQATLSVVQQHTDKFSVCALIAHDNISMMTQQCLQVIPKYVCMIHDYAAKKLKENLIEAGQNNIQVLSGMKNACELAALDDTDIVMSSIVGVAGTEPTFSALRAGKKVLLASKEILVTCGMLFIEEAYKFNAQILPIDSEHNAIFQSLPVQCQKNLGYMSLSENGISSIILTASGGACLYIPKNKLLQVTPDQVCKHPNWSMGRKISVDSATMMNKGLECIEASFLFNLSSDSIEILLHPQSIVHSMIRYYNGSILAHLSPADMQIAIAYAIAYPDQIKLNTIRHLDVTQCFNMLHFEKLNIQDYPCLKLALDVNIGSQAEKIILNAANEVAVEAFLNYMLPFTSIPDLINRALDTMCFSEPKNINDVLYIDKHVRATMIKYVLND